jgi:broad specificity phosphatase PhoE
LRNFLQTTGTLQRRDERAHELAEQLNFYQPVHSVLNSHVNKTVVVVSHGTVIALFASRLTGRFDMLLWSELGLPSFIVIDLESKTVIAKENIV